MNVEVVHSLWCTVNWCERARMGRQKRYPVWPCTRQCLQISEWASSQPHHWRFCTLAISVVIIISGTVLAERR